MVDVRCWQPLSWDSGAETLLNVVGLHMVHTSSVMQQIRLALSKCLLQTQLSSARVYSPRFKQDVPDACLPTANVFAALDLLHSCIRSQQEQILQTVQRERFDNALASQKKLMTSVIKAASPKPSVQCQYYSDGLCAQLMQKRGPQHKKTKGHVA